jgi:DNA polymerase delta subunit 1
MLRSWGEFVKEVDPDIIIGYNTSQFDIPYLMDRAKALQLTDFPYLSRLKGASAALPSSVLPSFARLV